LLACYVGVACLIAFSCRAGARLAMDHGPAHDRAALPQIWAAGDGIWYGRIAADGYCYDVDRASSIAFFPAYPLLSRCLSNATGLSVGTALLVVSNGCHLIATALFAVYLQRRALPVPEAAPVYALAAFTLLPTTFFFRMAYSESLFLAIGIGFMLLMRRNASPLVVALTAGAATAARPIGVALLPLAAHYVFFGPRRPLPYCFGRSVLLAVSAWGILAFAVYQWIQFGEPFAFVATQRHFHLRPPMSLPDRLLQLASLDTVWSVYRSSSAAYWGRFSSEAFPVLSLQCANPVYWLGAAVLLFVGIWTRWLNWQEAFLATALLLIPYVTRGCEMCMASQGRFAAVAFPVYIVAGEILARVPPVVAVLVLAVLAALLCIYSAQFAAGGVLI
ncbi:MAG TPA: hypothetical protein VF278_19130, partial [Pirellulales bacterium]